MEMLSQRQVTFFLLVCFSTILVNDAANTSTSCPEVACLGQPLNITCDMTGEYETVGFSRPDNLEVATCLANDKCFVNDANYEIVFRSPEKHILRIKKFAKKDIGMWNCRDGTDPLLKTCHVDGYDVKQSPTPPTPDCVKVNTTFSPSTLCKGFEEDPNVNITIMVANLPYTFTYDQYKQNDDVFLPYIPKGGDVECRVTGPASQCYTVSKPYKNEICPPGFPIWASIVIGVGAALVVGLAVEWFYCKPRDKGLIHFVMAKLNSRNADVTTEDTSMNKKKEEKKEETTDRTDSPEKKPLLDEKTTNANSHVTVENETDMKNELEPEDKEDAVKPQDKEPATTGVKPQDKGPAILEVKPQDEGSARTGVKPQDEGAAITGVKPQDEGAAILDVKSENKEAA